VGGRDVMIKGGSGGKILEINYLNSVAYSLS
jgi:hypothetical protein